MSACANCGKEILGEGAYGINPQAVCICCVHERRIAPSSPVNTLADFFNQTYRLLDNNGNPIKEASGKDAVELLCAYKAWKYGDGPVKIEQYVGGQWLHVSGISPVMTFNGSTG